MLMGSGNISECFLFKTPKFPNRVITLRSLAMCFWLASQKANVSSQSSALLSLTYCKHKDYLGMEQVGLLTIIKKNLSRHQDILFGSFQRKKEALLAALSCLLPCHLSCI